ncbi:RNA 2',3'-cyclic phosphodiesterase [Candidatus Litorirhabdus singularis]|nr:RNA 2',3'-cyclic phosphodiesterase [Candidatus Litorirhabdus singularis]
MRAFFAFKPKPEICLNIESWRRLNWPLLARPVPVANYHMTLAFLGDINEPQLEALIDKTSTLELPSFKLTLDTTGFWSKTGILWLGPSTPPAALNQLAQALGSVASSCQLPVARSQFKPHLTLARRVNPPPGAPLQLPEFSCACSSFALFESSQGKHGVSYHTVAEWALHPSAGKRQLNQS